MPPPTDDPYLDPSTGILRNLVGAETLETLGRFESDLTTVRTIQIQANNLVPPSRDLTEIRSIHRHLFQDVFAWAGDLRTVDMRKGDGQFFAPAVGLELNLRHLFAALRDSDFLRGLGHEDFLHQLARFYDDLNFIHPFREGNGRTQRLFWSRVSFQAGWVLDWRPIHGALLDEVSRAAREEANPDGLVAALSLCVSPAL